jgi:D-serine deaminase-like pyridoxal phosphate-dependent protein
MCAAVGAADVLLAMPCVGINAHRLAELALKFPDTQFSSIVDDVDTVRFLASAAQQHNVTLGVYLELDCGMSRTGIFPGDEAAILAHAIKDTPRLQFRGLHAYDGHIHDDSLDVRRERCDAAFEPVLQFRCRLQGEGIIVKELVAGGSPTFGIHATYPDRTLSPGTTVLWDFGYGDKYPADLPFQPAAVLLARVISKPGKNRITLDLGHKSVAPENPHPRVRFEELPDAVALMQSEEHLVLETERAHEFTIGQALHGLPRHVCPTVSMHGEAYIIEDGQTTERWPITARNRLITV